MPNKIKIIFSVGIVCFAFLFNYSYSQPVQLRFENYNVRDGLSDNICRDIYQDSRGFIWTATENGLNRYDGVSFQNFYHIPSDSNSLSGNIIRTMTEMPGGLLVIGTNDGLCVYNIYKNRFENYRVKQKELFPGGNTLVRKTFCDAGKNLWVNHSGVIDIFDSLLNYKFRFTDLPQGKILKGILIVFNYPVLDAQNNLWIPSDNMGIVIVERKTWNVTCYKNSYDSLFTATPIRGFYLDSFKNIVWFSPWGEGLCKYDLHEKKLTKYIFPAPNKSFSYGYNTFNGIVPVGDKLLCGSETGGLFEFNPVDGNYKIHTHDIYNHFSISSNEIDKMFTDDEGNLWISTYDGLAKAALSQTPFHYYSEQFRQKINEPFPQLLCFALVDSTWLLVGTETIGLFFLNITTGEIKHCINREPLHENENVIIRLFVDHNKTIWVGTFDGFFIYNPEKNILTKPTGIFTELPKEEVTAIHQDSYGDYWFGFRRRMMLAHYSSKEKKMTRYFTESEIKPGEKTFPLSFVSKIREEKDGNIWLSTIGDHWFVLWNRAENSLTNFPKTEFKQGKSSEWFSDLLPDTGSTLWLSSFIGHGLLHYDFSTSNTESFSRQEGLCNEIVKSLTRDADGNLWLGTQGGLAKFNPSEKKFKNFDITDGLPDNYFMGASYFDSASNLVYLLTPHDVVYFNPDELNEKSSSQNLCIQKIQINGRDTAIDSSQPLQLSYNQNYINIEYTSVNFKDGSKTKFYYLLDGLDNNWNDAGSKRFASYSNLAPGNYIFKLKASVGNNESGKEINALTFTILPPFWKTWWFRLMLLLFIVSCIYWIVVRRVRMIRKEEKLKTEFNKQLAEVEMKALRAQMNPHFIFNCLNSINKFILENDTEKASRYLSKFSKLIRMILENSEQQTITLRSEVEMLEAYLEMEANRFKTKFEYKISVDGKINMSDIEIPSMLIQPYVENAIWHGLLQKDGNGVLKITITKNGSRLLCVIEDNGIGRQKARELKEKKILNQKSMGMKVTEERMHLLSLTADKKPEVKITDLSENGTASGTKVELTIPLSYTS
ncbi:MAG TPA: histidine kinase [Bacteroidia bacterium]|nr:histidine kinase [Bacteroidia bacterium]